MGLWSDEVMARWRGKYGELSKTDISVETVPSETRIPVMPHTITSAASAAMQSPGEPGPLLAAGGAPMPTDPTLQTLRASGGFTMPEGLKQYLPLIMVFALFIIILVKK